MSTETPQRTHDSDADRRPPDGEDAPDRTPDDELVVAVYPRRVHEQLQSELDARRERPCREYEREYADLLAERARLADEVAALERELEQAESRLDAVVERYERILAARTGTDRERPAGADRDERENCDGRESTVRRRESGPVARLKHWLR